MESASVLDMLWEYLKEKKIINELEQDILSTIERPTCKYHLIEIKARTKLLKTMLNT